MRPPWKSSPPLLKKQKLSGPVNGQQMFPVKQSKMPDPVQGQRGRLQCTYPCGCSAQSRPHGQGPGGRRAAPASPRITVIRGVVAGSPGAPVHRLGLSLVAIGNIHGAFTALQAHTLCLTYVVSPCGRHCCHLHLPQEESEAQEST